MTPIEYLRKRGVPVSAGGRHDVYSSWHDRVVLTDATAHGKNASTWLAAFHELGHWQQRREWPWLFYLTWLTPVRWYLEMDAWRRAARMLAERGPG